MKKKLVIVTTDNEIEAVMLVDDSKLSNTRKVIAKTREKYYEEECHSDSLKGFLEEAMKESGIECEIISYEKM